MNSTKVVNLKTDKYDIYIGRGSIWGNPFKIGRDGTREEVVEQYRQYILKKPYLLDALPKLKGKRLGCFCRPPSGFNGKLLCHGQIIAGLIENINPESIE